MLVFKADNTARFTLAMARTFYNRTHAFFQVCKFFNFHFIFSIRCILIIVFSSPPVYDSAVKNNDIGLERWLSG